MFRVREKIYKQQIGFFRGISIQSCFLLDCYIFELSTFLDNSTYSVNKLFFIVRFLPALLLPFMAMKISNEHLRCLSLVESRRTLERNTRWASHFSCICSIVCILIFFLKWYIMTITDYWSVHSGVQDKFCCLKLSKAFLGQI